ncbi:MAG: amidase, partial [Alphaproteobacteria bacterium]
PVALKDLVEMEGRVTTGGSAAWRDRRSAVTATIVRKLMAAGMIVLGKTHTVEFAYGGWGTNQHMGTPRNPWDMAVHRIPGGSSSGSGVAVAAGLTAAAIGTDTGGSVRLPAGFCGIVGLKTTLGRVSTWGVLPLSETLDTVGPMTRSVEDAALLFDALQGPDPQDPNTLRRDRLDVLSPLRRGVAGLRLAALPDAEREGIHPEVLASYDAALACLEALGASIVPIVLPQPIASYAAPVATIIATEGYANLHETVEHGNLPLDRHVRDRLMTGKAISGRDYVLTLRAQRRLKQAMAEALDGIDALLTPTTAVPAPALEDIDEATTPATLTRMANFAEMCGLSLPDGFTAGGLPTGLQILCRGHEDATALRIGWAYEQATEWHRRTPPGLGG